MSIHYFIKTIIFVLEKLREMGPDPCPTPSPTTTTSSTSTTTTTTTPPPTQPPCKKAIETGI